MWIELIPVGLILALVAWIFLRPYPGVGHSDNRPPTDKDKEHRDD